MMNLQEFQTMLAQAANPPVPGNPGGFNVDAWCRGVASTTAQRMDSFGMMPKSMRLDTATGLFEHQLRHVMARSYDRKYPGLFARSMMSPAGGIPAGAMTVAQRGYDVMGKPQLLVNDARDLARVTLQAQQDVTHIIGIGCKWRINYDEMLQAAMAGVDLDGKGMSVARQVMEREIDIFLSTGDVPTGLLGFLSHATKAPAAAGAGIELYTTGAPAAFIAAWDAAATAAQILADFAILEAKFRADNIYEPTDMVLGSGTWSRLNTLTVVAAQTDTVLDVIKKRYPHITFRHWHRCDAAGVGGVERAVMWARSPDVMESIVSLEPTNLPPVWDGFGWETITYARCGGTQAADTTGIVYIDM